MLRRANRCWHVVMCCDVRIDAGTKCWSSGKGDYHVGHVTGAAQLISAQRKLICIKNYKRVYFARELPVTILDR